MKIIKRTFTANILLLLLVLTTSCGKLNQLFEGNINHRENVEKIASEIKRVTLIRTVTGTVLSSNSLKNTSLNRSEYTESDNWMTFEYSFTPTSNADGIVRMLNGNRYIDKNGISFNKKSQNYTEQIKNLDYIEWMGEIEYSDGKLFYGKGKLTVSQSGSNIVDRLTNEVSEIKTEENDNYASKTEFVGEMTLEDKNGRELLKFVDYVNTSIYERNDNARKSIITYKSKLLLGDYEGTWIFETDGISLKTIINECEVKYKKTGESVGKILFNNGLLDYAIVMD